MAATHHRKNSSLEKALQTQHLVQQASTKIQRSTALFLRNIITAIHSLNLPTSQAELDIVAHLWFGTPTWSRHHISSLAQDSSDNPAAVAQHEHEASITKLDELLQLPHPRISGIAPPKPLPTRTAFVSELHKAVLGGEYPELMNDDFAAFLACTDGIALPSFLRTELAGFGELDVNIPTDVKPWLEALVVDEHRLSEHEPKVTSKLQVVGGYRTGRNDVIWKGQPVAEYRCWYLYSRHRDGGQKPLPGQLGFNVSDGWAWRLVLCCEGDVKETEDEKVRTFEGIADFVTWLADWYARVDMHDVCKRYVIPGPECEYN